MNKPEQKRVKTFEPLEGIFNTFRMIKDNIVGKKVSPDGNITDKFDDIMVDTCCVPDTQVWETGIHRESIEGNWVIVTQYSSKKEAVRGHKQWVEYLKEDPNCELTDIDMWNLNSLKKEE